MRTKEEIKDEIKHLEQLEIEHDKIPIEEVNALRFIINELKWVLDKRRKDLNEMNKTLTRGELKDQNVIAELNTEIANKKIARLKIYNNGSLICTLDPSEMKAHVLFDVFFSLTAYHPYLHILLLDSEFSSIEIIEAD